MEEQTLDDRLLAWQTKRQEAAAAVTEEMEMRKALMAELFPEPKEGVNTFPLPAKGWSVKGTHKINYKLLLEMLPGVREQLASLNMSVEGFYKAKPELVEGEYKKWRDDPTVGPILKSMVLSTEGSPTLEIVGPKEKVVKS